MSPALKWAPAGAGSEYMIRGEDSKVQTSVGSITLRRRIIESGSSDAVE
jgi:hypothetical protein